MGDTFILEEVGRWPVADEKNQTFHIDSHCSRKDILWSLPITIVIGGLMLEVSNDDHSRRQGLD